VRLTPGRALAHQVIGLGRGVPGAGATQRPVALPGATVQEPTSGISCTPGKTSMTARA
jgi:hypothetical protein